MGCFLQNVRAQKDRKNKIFIRETIQKNYPLYFIRGLVFKRENMR